VTSPSNAITAVANVSCRSGSRGNDAGGGTCCNDASSFGTRDASAAFISAGNDALSVRMRDVSRDLVIGRDGYLRISRRWLRRWVSRCVKHWLRFGLERRNNPLGFLRPYPLSFGCLENCVGLVRIELALAKKVKCRNAELQIRHIGGFGELMSSYIPLRAALRHCEFLLKPRQPIAMANLSLGLGEQAADLDNVGGFAFEGGAKV
jgi:hypothetical protein